MGNPSLRIRVGSALPLIMMPVPVKTTPILRYGSEEAKVCVSTIGCLLPSSVFWFGAPGRMSGCLAMP